MPVSASAPADLVLVSGCVQTMDAARRWTSGVAIRDGTIVGVGSDAEVLDLAGARTRRIDLHGRTVLPAFQDAHVHPSMAGLGLLRCPLHDLPRTLADYQLAIGTYAADHASAPWVLGDGWYMEAFPGGTPAREDLDAVVPDRPAFFVNRDGHGAWVNSRALAEAGVTRETPDPFGGRIEREVSGEPQGTLHEGAMELVRRIIPPASVEERAAGIELAQAYLHRLGITAWQDAWVTPDDLEAYLLVAGRGRLTARVTACHWWERDEGGEQIESIVDRRARVERAAREGATAGRLRANTVKIMQDGVAENYTAAMLESYTDGHGHATGNRGMSYVDPELLKEHVTKLDSLGFQVHFHALGDRAVREALDAVEAALAANGAHDARHHLAHLQVVDPADVARFRPLGAVANIQPYWACNDPQMTELTLPFLAPQRAAMQYPFRSLRQAGAVIAGGSDWSVSTPNVLQEVEVAVNRISSEDRSAPPFLPDQAIELIDGLAAFTIGSAYVNRLDDVTGTIEPGKEADIVVLDRDVFARDAGHTGDARVLLTLLRGETVHQDPALAASVAEVGP